MRGFALLELLVVVAIIAIVSSALAASAWPARADTADIEARRLAALLEAAISEARVSGRAIVWAPAPDGYAFLRKAEDGRWERFPEGSIYKERVLAGDARLRAEQALLMPYGTAGQVAALVSDSRTTVVLRSEALGRISLERIHAH
jgi:type II secretion system protein H